MTTFAAFFLGLTFGLLTSALLAQTAGKPGGVVIGLFAFSALCASITAVTFR